MKKLKNSLLALFLIGLAIYFESGGELFPSLSTNESNGDDVFNQLFQNRQSDRQVEGSGHVVRILADDNVGSRHQRFIVELDSGQTLLISHNIDLAPRIDQLARGDVIGFNGEYEWSTEGGVVHWTHHDPQGRHSAGWLQHKTGLYQ